MVELKEQFVRRWQGAPRTRLRVVGSSDQPVDEPLLVCAACHGWTPHRRPADALPSSSSEVRGHAVDDLFDCGVCHTRRRWGTRWVMRLV